MWVLKDLCVGWSVNIDSSYNVMCVGITESSWSVIWRESTKIAFIIVSLQKVGQNSSGDVRRLCQQKPGAWTVSPFHPTTLDHGASSILRHSDEEPGAQRAALTSAGRLYFMSVPFVFDSEWEPAWTCCTGPFLCLKIAALNPNTNQGTGRYCSCWKTYRLSPTVASM